MRQALLPSLEKTLARPVSDVGDADVLTKAVWHAGAAREMSVLEITNAVNDSAGPGGVRATHALVQKVLSSMESITYDSTRGRAKANM